MEREEEKQAAWSFVKREGGGQKCEWNWVYNSQSLRRVGERANQETRKNLWDINRADFSPYTVCCKGGCGLLLETLGFTVPGSVGSAMWLGAGDQAGVKVMVFQKKGRRETRSWWRQTVRPGATSCILEVGTVRLLYSWKLTAQMLTLGTCSVILLNEGVLVFLHFISGQSGFLVFFFPGSYSMLLCHCLFFWLTFQVRRSKVDDIKKSIFRKWKCLLSLCLPPNLYHCLNASLGSFGWNDSSTYQQVTLSLWLFSDQACTELSNLCHSCTWNFPDWMLPDLHLVAGGSLINTILKSREEHFLWWMWIRLHLLRQGTQVHLLVREDSTCRRFIPHEAHGAATVEARALQQE